VRDPKTTANFVPTWFFLNPPTSAKQFGHGGLSASHPFCFSRHVIFKFEIRVDAQNSLPLEPPGGDERLLP
jgi:hypothetical protein